MDNVILNSYSRIPNLDVSRETCNDLETLILMIQEKNREINIISKKIIEKELIRERHIIDSAQIIDFVDLNSNTTSDLGSGAGMPGLIVAILMKNLKNQCSWSRMNWMISLKLNRNQSPKKITASTEKNWKKTSKTNLKQ